MQPKEEFIDGRVSCILENGAVSMTCADLATWCWMGRSGELEIYFSNGHKPVKIYGDNAYPYNFDRFQELLGI